VLPAVTLWFASVAAAALIAGAPAVSTPPRAYVAPCPSGVSGGLPADYQRSSLVAGPLAIYQARGFARYPARFIAPTRPGGRRFPAFEAAAAIGQGHVVTIAVAPEDRPHLAFLFDPRAWAHADEGYRVADGTPAVTFRGCTAPFTQYQGGFVVDGPRCATLEAWIDRATAPVRRVVSFGSGDCGAPDQTRPGGPTPPPLTLGATPAGVRRTCRRARLTRCPARWPMRPGSRPHGGRDLARGPGALLSFADVRVEGEGGHLLLGERAARYDLRGRAGEPFVRRGPDPLQVPSRLRTQDVPGGGRYVVESPARILRRALVRGHPALVLAAPPYPPGGIHGDHVIVIWNERGRGHLVSLHFRDEEDPTRYDQADRVAAALAVARS
jgi:hypothetical protein